MSSVVISGDTSGAITLSAPAVAGTNTLTLPASTGTVMVNGPAFSAYNNASQSISSGVFTKIQFQVKDFDTANCFDNTTNYRFTPTVAGYYQITASVSINSTAASTFPASIYKNGTEYRRCMDIRGLSTISTSNPLLSALVYCNGSTDYIEIYGYNNGTSPTVNYGGIYTWFNGVLVRGA